MQASTSVSQAYGSTLSLAVMISVAMTAAWSAPRLESINSQDLRPSANRRNACSAAVMARQILAPPIMRANRSWASGRSVQRLGSSSIGGSIARPAMLPAPSEAVRSVPCGQLLAPGNAVLDESTIEYGWNKFSVLGLPNGLRRFYRTAWPARFRSSPTPVTGRSRALSSSKVVTMVQPTEEQIRQRAYELWEQNHRPDKRDDEFWHQAEQELTKGATSDEKSKTFLE
jgi:hypothetical protein